MSTPTQDSPSPSPPPATTTPFLTPESPETPSNHQSKYSFILQARTWRLLARIGFWLHTFPKPSPPAPSFLRYFNSTALDNGTNSADLELAFYVPGDYARQVQRGKRYPVVVNFHGGGFTIGRTSDDARWAATVVRDTSAVVISVAYRLAPEHPFPTAVEDGVCALLYISANADTLGINASTMSLCGFSAGGNLVFTILLRLQTYLESLGDQAIPPRPCIVAIIAWYPGLDYRLSRSQRRAASLRPDKTLPAILTNLFDASYLPDPACVTSPYVSPAAASDEVLMTALPDNIALYMCEWDMLLQEDKDFGERLQRLGKLVRCVVVEERGHAFDKHPWPFGLDWKVEAHYGQACGWLREVLEGHEGRRLGAGS